MEISKQIPCGVLKGIHENLLATYLIENSGETLEGCPKMFLSSLKNFWKKEFPKKKNLDDF